MLKGNICIVNNALLIMTMRKNESVATENKLIEMEFKRKVPEENVKMNIENSYKNV